MKWLKPCLIVPAILVVIALAGCGGGGNSVQVSAPTGESNTQAARIDGNSTDTVVIPTASDALYEETMAKVRAAAGRMSARYTAPAGAQVITIQPSTQELSVQAQCGADYLGKTASVRKPVIWLAMAYDFCWKYDGLVQFDTSALAGVDPEKIIHAEVQLYQFQSYGHHNGPWKYDMLVGAYANLGPWSKSSTWFYNLPVFTDNYSSGPQVLNEVLGWKSWDVTEIVRAWRNGKLENYGLRMLTHQTNAPEDSNAKFYNTGNGETFDPSLAPTLVVYYGESDSDGDGVANEEDNCADAYNPMQEDLDADGAGDVCDPDDDGDLVEDTLDNCPAVFNPGQENNDGDSMGDVCDPDDDNDYVDDAADNCVFTPNPGQENFDGDIEGDACDPDDDNDSILDDFDSCPFEDPAGLDADGDGCIDTLEGLRRLIRSFKLAHPHEKNLLKWTDKAEKDIERGRLDLAENDLYHLMKGNGYEYGKTLSPDEEDLMEAYTRNVIIWMYL